jgi:hypothetical protein
LHARRPRIWRVDPRIPTRRLVERRPLKPPSRGYARAQRSSAAPASFSTCFGKHSVRLVEAPANSDDWYANLLWRERRKSLLVVHAGTLLSLFVAELRVSDLLPIDRRIVDLITAALLEEGLPIDARGRLEPAEVRLAKTASRHVLGVMNQIAFEIGWHTDQAGGLSGTSTSTTSTGISAAACTVRTATTRYRSNSRTNDSSAAANDLSPTTQSTQPSSPGSNDEDARTGFPAPTRSLRQHG